VKLDKTVSVEDGVESVSGTPLCFIIGGSLVFASGTCCVELLVRLECDRRILTLKWLFSSLIM